MSQLVGLLLFVFDLYLLFQKLGNINHIITYVGIYLLVEF